MKNQDLEKRKKLVKAWINKGKDDLLFAKAAFKETQFYDHKKIKK